MSSDESDINIEPALAQGWEVAAYAWRPESSTFSWSPELIRLYGLERAPAAERSLSEFVHPDDRSRVEADMRGFIGSDAPRYSHMFRIVRPDGSARMILDRGAIERDETGKALIVRGIQIDVTDEMHLSEAAEKPPCAAECRYQKVFEGVDEGFCVVEVDLAGPDGRIDYRIVEANPAFYEKTGFPRAILGEWLRKAAPDLEEHWYEIYGKVARTGQPVRFEQASDMLGRWFDVYAFQIDAPSEGRVAILFNDISQRKRQEAHTRHIMRELNHRSKNMLCLVQAIARQTAASRADDFLERFFQRIQALAAAQDLIVHNDWNTIPVADLVEAQLSHFSELIGSRIKIGGPSLAMTPDATQTLGMALHELATNAAKYGAISNDSGRIMIDWSVDPDAYPEARFVFSWAERGGPPVAEPKRRGFGSRVTVDMVRASTGGDVLVDYTPAGLTWRLTCPAARILDCTSARNIAMRPPPVDMNVA